ncbi:MAG: hypothetical protein P8170_08865 [Gemmatimonadota bacterium]|jgi:hypothetical protein
MFRGLTSLLCALAVAAAGRTATDTRPHSADAVAGPVSDLAGAVRPLPFFYDLYTFRGDAGGTDVIASFAVPVGRLQRENEDNRVRYRFDVTFVLSDTVLHSVSRADDSVFVSLLRPLDGDHLLHTHVEVQAPPSVTTVHRVVMTDATTPGIGQLYDAPFPVPDYRGTHLMLSDVAMGRPDAEAGWTRGDVTLALFPTSQFPEGSFDVYYEVYNLPTGNRYVTEVSIEPVDVPEDWEGRDRSTVRTRFSGESPAGPDGSVRELRRVEASLPEGGYRLTVTVMDRDSGQTASRSRLFRVQGWRRGATLVEALPRRSGGS